MLYTISMNILSATEARKNFFDILNAVIFKGEEFTITKADAGSVRIVRDRKKPTPAEIKKTLSDLRRVFAKSKKRKYWSVLDTPAWKKRESKYLEDLSRGIVR